MRIGKLIRRFLARLKGADNRRATAGLHRKHARMFPIDPTERLHFVERFPHADEARAAAGRIKNHSGQCRKLAA